jgi:nucleoside-diphosphate-sugar epimerase
VAGAVRVAEAASSAGARAFVAVTSGSMYMPSWKPIPETGDFQHFNPYAISAIAAEQALQLVHAGKPRMALACVRLFGLFGPTQAEGMVPGLIRRVKEGKPILLPPHPDDKHTDANGLQLSVTYVDDAVVCLETIARAAVEHKLKDRVLNVASPEPTSIRRIAELVGHETHLVPHYEQPDRPRDGELIADVSRLSNYLAVPSTPLDEAIRRTLAAEA